MARLTNFETKKKAITLSVTPEGIEEFDRIWQSYGCTSRGDFIDRLARGMIELKPTKMKIKKLRTIEPLPALDSIPEKTSDDVSAKSIKMSASNQWEEFKVNLNVFSKNRDKSARTYWDTTSALLRAAMDLKFGVEVDHQALTLEQTEFRVHLLQELNRLLKKHKLEITGLTNYASFLLHFWVVVSHNGSLGQIDFTAIASPEPFVPEKNLDIVNKYCKLS